MSSHSAMQHQNQHPDVSIFIRNLSEITDGKTLHSVFAKFGNIVSCKLAFDERGKSKGYAFVQFDSEDAARNAIEKVNNTMLDDKCIYVGKFIPRKGRNKERDERYIYTNLYVKNFGNNFTEDELLQLFEPFGKIKSLKIMTNLGGHSKGFGFVAYEKSEYAEEALAKLSGKVLSNGHKLYVARAQKKAERQQELERQFEEQEERKRQENTNGLNLYVKNLDDSVTNAQLRKEFSLYGPITSARIVTDNFGHSKGFGFVRFVSPVDACFAAAGLNGRMFGSKPLFVSLAQRKNERRALLVAQHMRQRLQATESVYVASSNRFYRRPLVETAIQPPTTTSPPPPPPLPQAMRAQPVVPSPTSSASRVGVNVNVAGAGVTPVRWTATVCRGAAEPTVSAAAAAAANPTPQSVWRSSSLARKIQMQRTNDFTTTINCLNNLKSQSQANLRFMPPMPVPVMLPTSQPMLNKSPTPSQTFIKCRASASSAPLTSSSTPMMTATVVNGAGAGVCGGAVGGLMPQMQMQQQQQQQLLQKEQLQQLQQQQEIGSDPSSSTATTTTTPPSTSTSPTPLSQQSSKEAIGVAALNSKTNLPHMNTQLPTVTPLTKFTKYSPFQQPTKIQQQIQTADMLSLHKYSSLLSFSVSPAASESIGSHNSPNSGSGGSGSASCSPSGSGSASSSSCSSGFNLHDEKQRIGERLFHRVEKLYPKLAGKITGMLLEMDNSDLYYLFENPDALREKIDEAYQVYMAYLVDSREGNAVCSNSGNISGNSGSVSGSPSSSASGSGCSSIDTD